MRRSVVLGYSGGLDTTYCAIALREMGFEPVCVTVDVGQGIDEKEINENAAKAGIKDLRIVDVKEEFVNEILVPSIMANAMYQGVYPLATALSRPIISKVMVDVARDIGTNHFAHGCTGKGNDQVRMELAIRTLVPSAEIVAPVRDRNLSRDEEIDFLESKGIHLGITRAKPFSVDQNLWGRSICAGLLEDPDAEPPESAFEWTASIESAGETGDVVEIGFSRGVPVSLNEEKLGVLALIEQLNSVAGRNGVGRIDHVEDRLVGLKSREIYEAPAATVLITAHRALESLVLTKSALKFKRLVEVEYSESAYLGTWFSRHHYDLLSYLAHNQVPVTGTVRLRLLKSTCRVIGRRSANSLYDKLSITYGQESTFDQRAATGYINVLAQEFEAAGRVQPFNLQKENAALGGIVDGGTESDA